MLTKLSCKNFRSIGNDPLTLDLIASPWIKMHPDHVRTSSNARVLRNAAIYGANAAGKSTIVRALGFMKASVVGGSLPQNTLREYCRSGKGLSRDESVFEVQFSSGNRVFDYGFSCILSQYAVTSEWLYALGEKPSLLFQRERDGSVELGDNVKERASDNDLTRFDVYSEDFQNQAKANPAALFLSSVSDGKQFAGDSPLSSFEQARNWFVDSLLIMGANQPSPTSDFYSNDKTLSEVADVLASFDTGIDSLSKKAISLDELERYVDFGTAVAIRQLLQQNFQASNNGKIALTIRSGDAFVGIEREYAKEPTLTVLEIGHQGSAYNFEFNDESDGTKRLFDFMDILFTRRKDAVFVIDEIDRSLHPMLTRQLVELFNRVHSGNDCQLLFTTHENDIMSFDCFRKDEIWFVDRNDQGVSRLYSLDDFNEVRTDSRLSKRYLEGRYGGLPVLSMGKALATFGKDAM